MPTEEERATCRHCRDVIVWYFDRDDAAEIVGSTGVWLHSERMTEDCDANEGEMHEPL